MHVHSFTVYDVLVRNAGCHPGRPAVVTEDGDTVTFTRLLERVDALATGLAGAGLGKGDRVLVIAQNSVAYFELYFACARQGIVPYPLNWRLSADEVARSCVRARPRALVIDEAYHEVLPGDGAGLEGVTLKAQLDGNPPDGWIGFDRLRSPEATAERPEVAADEPFAIIPTAAVDVIPRGAVLTHTNVVTANLQTAAAMNLVPADGNLLALPLFHIAALGSGLAVMQAGGQNVVMPRFDPAEAVRLIDAHGLTFISDFPPVLVSVLDQAKEQGSDLPSLRIVNGLDSPDTIERLHAETGADFWSGFGQTETTGWVTLQRFRDRPGAAGVPGPACRVRVVDDYDRDVPPGTAGENLAPGPTPFPGYFDHPPGNKNTLPGGWDHHRRRRDVPPGTAGEILARGPTVFHGYFDQPEVNEHTFRGGWHHTGDVGRFDTDGYLHYVKRKPEKDLIKPGGENVYPAEVETTIMELPEASGVCVFGVPDRKWGEGIMAVVETAGDLSAAQVVDHVGSRIARFKRPQHVAFTDSLPRDESGAVDREAVKAKWAETVSG